MRKGYATQGAVQPGQVFMEDGEHTGAFAGTVLRSG